MTIFSFKFQPLSGAKRKRRQLLLLGALLAAGIVIIAGIVLAVVFLTGDDTPTHEPLMDERDPLSLDDVLKGRLQARRFNGTWIDEDSFYYYDINVGLIF